MACLKSSLWTICASQSFFQPALGNCWLFSFIVSVHRFWLVSSLRFVKWYDSFIPIASASLAAWSLLLKSSLWYPEWWNLHPPHKKDCLHIQMILWHPWFRTNLLGAWFRPWYVWETWVPNVCPKIHPACGPLQNMQASGALGHCVSVIPPPPLSTALSCSCTWSWQRAHLHFCELICRWTYYRHLHEVSYMYGGQPTGNILWKWSIVKNNPVSTCMSTFAPPALSSPPITNHDIFIFAIRNEAYLGLPIY